jgi:hypothetical protein
MSDAGPAPGARSTDSPSAGTTVADIGSRSKKSIVKLRNGDGRLLEDVNALLDVLKAEAIVRGPARAVVVVVKEKRRGMSL